MLPGQLLFLFDVTHTRSPIYIDSLLCASLKKLSQVSCFDDRLFYLLTVCTA
jgi:hypothetical protein